MQKYLVIILNFEVYLSQSAKDLFKANKNKSGEIEYIIINKLIKLMEGINIREILENENLKKVANIVTKILIFNEQQEGRVHKILTLKEV